MTFINLDRITFRAAKKSWGKVRVAYFDQADSDTPIHITDMDGGGAMVPAGCIASFDPGKIKIFTRFEQYVCPPWAEA